MKSPKLCVVTPTKGRDSLYKTLASALLGPGDFWAVIGDGPQPAARAMVKTALASQHQGGRMVYLETGARLDRFGNPQRDMALKYGLPVDYYIFLDDDDIFTPGALMTIRNTVASQPRAGVMFRVEYPDGKILWASKRLTGGNVGGSMLVIPAQSKIPAWDGPWGQAYISDFHFINLWVSQNGGPSQLHWSEAIIIKCRPTGQPASQKPPSRGPAA